MNARTLISAACLTTCIAGGAFAADLPLRTAPPAFVPPLPIFTWTGAYFGINAGYVFDSSTRFDRTTGQLPNNQAALNTGLRPFATRVDDDGFTAGGQIGYNYQFGAGNGIVVGVEADAAYTDLDRTRDLTNTTNFGAGVVAGAGPTTRLNRYHGELDFLGTVRGRIGYAFNQFMIYGTGGFAYGQVDQAATFFAPNDPTTAFFTGRNSGLRTGYTYGGGVEYALPTNSFLNFFKSSAVTIKAEYLHYDLGHNTFTLASVNGGPGSYTIRSHDDGDLARVGLNYKF